MKVHPRNEGTSTIDLVLLVGMPVVTLILAGVVYWLSLPLLEMSGG